MGGDGQELEIKLYVADLEALRRRLESLGARLVQPRQEELNLRFDTPSGELARAHRVLRLRRDHAIHLTYKGPDEPVGGVRSRREIGVAVGDFEAAAALLEALGFRVSMTYEKRRAVFQLADVLVSLDELPYGDFTEIEGPQPAAIRAAAGQLGLDWEARIPQGYIALFERLRDALRLPFRDLTFENFAGLKVLPEQLGVRPADASPLPGGRAAARR